MSEKNIISKTVCDPSGTVKINFNEMDKSELLQMLAFMQSELEAREIVIATLKSEKCKQLLYQAKYGRLNTALVSSKVNSELSNDTNWNNCNKESVFLLADPFTAMQRDNQCISSGTHQNTLSIESAIESNLKPVYDSQLNQLENLISSQKKAQMKMKEQIVYLEKKCLKLTQALEDERNKHERDAAQGDDVLVMLEKERERLKSELEFEKSHSRKLERELKRMAAVIEDQKLLIQNQRLAASVILKTKKQLENDLKSFNHISNKPANSSDLECPKFHQDSTDNSTNSHNVKCNSEHRSHETGERLKFNQLAKSSRHNSHEGQLLANVHGNKYSQPKESISTNASNTPTDTIVAQISSMNNPSSKTRTNKQPESLLWKTYDPKSNMSNPATASSMTTKSPSNSRRQLPNVSMSNSIPVSSFARQTDPNFYKHTAISPIPATISAPITPYQKILSTPPPNSMVNQPSSFQTSLTSYGLFNIHSSSLQTVVSPSVATIYKSPISSKSDNLMTNNNIAARPRMTGTSVTNIVSTVAPSNAPLLRSGDSSPAIPKHVYVNGK